MTSELEVPHWPPQGMDTGLWHIPAMLPLHPGDMRTGVAVSQILSRGASDLTGPQLSLQHVFLTSAVSTLFLFWGGKPRTRSLVPPLLHSLSPSCLPPQAHICPRASLLLSRGPQLRQPIFLSCRWGFQAGCYIREVVVGKTSEPIVCNDFGRF